MTVMREHRIKRHLTKSAEGDDGIVLQPPGGDGWVVEHVSINHDMQFAFVTWGRDVKREPRASGGMVP